MNREIKFRGRRIDDGKWFYGNYVVENHLGVLKHGIMFYDRLEGIDVTVEVDERTVGSRHTQEHQIIFILIKLNGLMIWHVTCLCLGCMNHTQQRWRSSATSTRTQNY
jgi:hypothetical protein